MCAAFIGAVGIGGAWALFRYPIQTSAAIGGFLALNSLVRLEIRWRLKRLARERETDSICTFSRAFDLHATDPWIVRAVYEQLQAYLSSDHSSFPLRPTDRLVKDLLIDEDDLSFDIAEAIAQRTGRSLDCAEGRRSSAPVTTVGELVAFFNRLPMTSAT